MATAHPTSEHHEGVATLIHSAEQAATAWMRGDMEHYLELVHHAPGFTLAAPEGGAPVQHADRRAGFTGWHSPFADGQAALEITAAHAFENVVVLVMVERQHGRVAGMPDQDLSLRVTAVYRRNPSGWELLHRHADPLVRVMSPAQLAALMRGN